MFDFLPACVHLLAWLCQGGCLCAYLHSRRSQRARQWADALFGASLLLLGACVLSFFFFVLRPGLPFVHIAPFAQQPSFWARQQVWFLCAPATVLLLAFLWDATGLFWAHRCTTHPCSSFSLYLLSSFLLGTLSLLLQPFAC